LRWVRCASRRRAAATTSLRKNVFLPLGMKIRARPPGLSRIAHRKTTWSAELPGRFGRQFRGRRGSVVARAGT
jgi:hypothetical protein